MAAAAGGSTAADCRVPVRDGVMTRLFSACALRRTGAPTAVSVDLPAADVGLNDARVYLEWYKWVACPLIVMAPAESIAGGHLDTRLK